MPILSNTPTIRYITIQNLVIKDSNVYYPIVTTETSRKYIYWDKDSPYELICEDEMLEDRANLYLLVINKKGNFTIVNQDSISVNFDENIKLDGFNSKLNATVEKVDEHTKKFMSVTEDINGINKTVGTITEDLNETNEKLTNYKQTADQIAIDLQNTNKKYNDDKEFNKLRENIVSLLIDENSLLMELNSAIKDITRDNSFTSEEKTKVKETQSKITNKNDLLIIEVDKLVSMLEKEGLTDKKNQLTSIKEEYGNAFSLLNSTLNSLTSGNVITPTQITTLINCISNVSTKLTKLKNICDEIIFLGTGGTLYEEIVKINITAGGIYSKISSMEENIKSNLSLEKGILNQHVKDLQTTVDKIETIIKEIYIDGLVNQNEKDLVSQNLQSMENEHNDLIGKYNEYLSNKYLSQEMKAKLQGIYSDYVGGYDAFVNELNTVISDGFFNESEKTNVDLKLEDYRKNIIILHNNLSLAIDNYEENRYKSEIEAQKNQLQGEINEVKKDLTNLNDNIEGTFKNNIIDESERNAIKQNIKNLDIQKANIDSQYSQLYKNALLIDPLKTQFLNVYTNFNSSYDTLLATLNEILNKDTLITQQDKINMDRCYADLVLKTTEYTTVVNQVVEFIANAEAEQSKASFQDEINDLQQQIDGIDLNIDGAFADGILSEAEKISLKNNLDMLKVEKVDVDNQYKQTYSNSNLSPSNKSNLKTAYDNYIVDYNALVKFIETLITSADKVNESHKTQLDTLLKAHNDKLALYVIQYNLAIENISKSYTDAAKNTLQQQIKGVSDSISDLETDMNGVFQDSILTEAEKLSIKERLQNLQVEKINIDSQYNTLIGNVDLIDKDSSNTPKTNLKNSYVNLSSSYTKLVDAIDALINTQGILDESHRRPVNDAFADYKNKLGVYSKRVNEAIDAISKKRVDDEAGYRKEQYSEINRTVEGISSKVVSIEKTANSAVEKATAAQQTAEGFNREITNKLNDEYYNKVSIDETINGITQKVTSVQKDINKNGGVNLIPNPTASIDLTGWGSAPKSNVIRYYTTGAEPYIEDSSGEPSIKESDDKYQPELHLIEPYGGGLAMLLKDCNGKILFFDGGYKQNAQHCINYLKSIGVQRITYYIVTHSHSDHVEASPTILQEFGADYAIIKESDWNKLPVSEFEWKTPELYQAFVNKCKELNIPILNPKVDIYIKLSDYSNLRIYNSNNTNHSDYNHQSLMFLYTYKNNKIFLAADGTNDGDISCYNQIGKVDIMQLGHHGDGSIGGSSQKLIDELKPKHAYFASDFLATGMPYNSDLTLKRVSWHYGLSYSHGTGFNGDFKFVLDGNAVTTTAKSTFAKDMWYERKPGMWFWFKTDGYLARNEWLKISGYQYYFGDDYVMYRNKWKQDGTGAWFYLKDNGKMAVNETININGKDYVFDSNGACTNPN